MSPISSFDMSTNTSNLLLTQPLTLQDINIDIFDQRDTVIQMIDDVELLAILGLTPSNQEKKRNYTHTYPTTTKKFKSCKQ